MSWRKKEPRSQGVAILLSTLGYFHACHAMFPLRTRCPPAAQTDSTPDLDAGQAEQKKTERHQPTDGVVNVNSRTGARGGLEIYLGGFWNRGGLAGYHNPSALYDEATRVNNRKW